MIWTTMNMRGHAALRKAAPGEADTPPCMFSGYLYRIDSALRNLKIKYLGNEKLLVVINDRISISDFHCHASVIQDDCGV